LVDSQDSIFVISNLCSLRSWLSDFRGQTVSILFLNHSTVT